MSGDLKQYTIHYQDVEGKKRKFIISARSEEEARDIAFNKEDLLFIIYIEE